MNTVLHATFACWTKHNATIYCVLGVPYAVQEDEPTTEGQVRAIQGTKLLKRLIISVFSVCFPVLAFYTATIYSIFFFYPCHTQYDAVHITT